MSDRDHDDDIVRVLRVLTYEGPRRRILETLGRGAVPANGQIAVAPQLSIRSIVIGESQRVPPPKPTPADAIVAQLEKAKDSA